MELMTMILVMVMMMTVTQAKVSLYLSSDQTEALYGIKTPGLYYITEGVVNKYAMNFQHQVINNQLSLLCMDEYYYKCR